MNSKGSKPHIFVQTLAPRDRHHQVRLDHDAVTSNTWECGALFDTVAPLLTTIVVVLEGFAGAAELLRRAGSRASTEPPTCMLPDVSEELGKGVGEPAFPTAFLLHRSATAVVAPESCARGVRCAAGQLDSPPAAENGVEQLFCQFRRRPLDQTVPRSR